MGFFDFFRTPDINEGVEEFRKTEKAFLLDVRTKDEYAQGHIPGSINLPLDEIATVADIISDRSAPVFVHCLSGGRSAAAVSHMERLGYTNVKNIGGIGSYRGEIER
ncbi:MAG: rhodanese-like domain-containing protein [Spirochaetales bacterium]|nr:rhodanese-like domain-containing protein [Spirochaetales bacterium]